MNSSGKLFGFVLVSELLFEFDIVLSIVFAG